MEVKQLDTNLGCPRQNVVLKHGIDKHNRSEIVNRINESGHKVQAQIQGDKERVIGKKNEDLHEEMALQRRAELGVPESETARTSGRS